MIPAILARCRRPWRIKGVSVGLTFSMRKRSWSSRTVIPLGLSSIWPTMVSGKVPHLLKRMSR